jgi:hypothetical protein
VTTIRIETTEGDVEVDDFLDDSATLPISLPPDITPTPGLLRLLADVQYQTAERIAAHLERPATGKREVLMGRGAAGAVAAAEVRSFAWARAA